MILYDTSAFFSHLQSNKLDINGFILDLTFYELGNVLWKHVKFKSLSQKDAEIIIKVVRDWEGVVRINPDDETDIFKISVATGLTFYDAAYLYFTKKYNFELLTCDKKLWEKGKSIKLKMKLVR